jgi:uncharacterized protein
MKILAVGDTESSYIWDYFDKERFSDIDLIVSTGDLHRNYLSFLVTMLNVPLVYVPGNHDQSYLEKPPEGCIDIDGKLLTIKNIRLLGFGGSPRYKQGPFQYTNKEMKRRVRRLWFKLWRSGGFDILVTHSPAYGLGDGKDHIHRGFPVFNRLLDRYKPQYFLHGHQHLSYGSKERILHYKNTMIINTDGYYIFDF